MMNRETLKFMAIKERIAEITAMYEDKIADLRADITLEMEKVQQRSDEKDREIMELKAQLGEVNVVSSEEK
ncbi:hypothetical protein SEA_TOMAS_69 [Streptomyces phage Tomas]|uniref:Uncharacterized protein n=1 Tax=Streptomyces phage Tomas TaxID=2914443 RepID=A0AA49BS28_9CAUD|nr:hypothetical protein PP453_gp210 [Streptomyces phage Tomas]UMO76258.1 hypothetical protein SEA_TOMAS_69 [Streptomyces phage Tomas]